MILCHDKIGERCFSYLKRYAIIVIPDTVKVIADDAFLGSRVSFVCSNGSTAELFAKEHGIKIIVKSTPE